jgi:hypothetical protein
MNVKFVFLICFLISSDDCKEFKIEIFERRQILINTHHLSEKRKIITIFQNITTSWFRFESINKFRRCFTRILSISKSDFKSLFSIALTIVTITMKQVEIKITQNVFEADVI